MQTIDTIVQVLRQGGIMLYPTDSLWGLGCDATNQQAVDRIFEIKQRAASKSLIVLADSQQMIDQYVKEVPELSRDLVDLSTTPLTIIYPQGVKLASGVCAPDGSVAIRVPQHDFCQQIIRKLGKPLVSTSANVSGNSSPARFAEIPADIQLLVDVVVGVEHEGQPTRKPSSIIKLGLDGQVKVIR